MSQRHAVVIPLPATLTNGVDVDLKGRPYSTVQGQQELIVYGDHVPNTVAFLQALAKHVEEAIKFAERLG